MYANIRGMKGKKNSLIESLNDNNPQVFLLTETQLRSNIGMQIKGYQFYGRKREGKNGGGVAILVRNDIIDKVIPHISDRPIELMWISIRRQNKEPLFLGVHYGKQESRTNKEEIENEMALLKEEIREMNNEGEIVIAMDANAKVNLINEGISRNGYHILKVFQDEDIQMLNGSAKCEGAITRKNTKNVNEISAIDFVVASHDAAEMINKVIIDESGTYKIKGRHETDHNTFLIKININKLDKQKVVRKTDWNMRASSEKWSQFDDELKKRQSEAQNTLENKEIDFDVRYKQWYNELDMAARLTIGKTTFKAGGKEKFSNEVKELQKRKKVMKNEIRDENDQERKSALIIEFKQIKEETVGF